MWSQANRRKAGLIVQNLMDKQTHPETQMKSQLVVMETARLTGLQPTQIMNKLIEVSEYEQPHRTDENKYQEN